MIGSLLACSKSFFYYFFKCSPSSLKSSELICLEDSSDKILVAFRLQATLKICLSIF